MGLTLASRKVLAEVFNIGIIIERACFGEMVWTFNRPAIGGILQDASWK